MTVAGGFVCYAITYLVTDVIGEIWGKKEANKVVLIGFTAQIVASILIVLTGFMPYLIEEQDIAFNVLLGSNWLLTAASLLAYIVSQSIDVYIFHKIKEKNLKHKWIRNNVSTITSQLFDTVIFIVIGFGIGQGLIWNDLDLLLSIMFGQYFIKVFVALIDTPFFYILTRKEK